MSAHPRNYTGTIATSFLIGLLLSTVVVVMYEVAAGTVELETYELMGLGGAFTSGLGLFAVLLNPYFSVPNWRTLRYSMVWMAGITQTALFLWNMNKPVVPYFSLVFALIFFVYAVMYTTMESMQCFRIEKLSVLPAYVASSFQQAPAVPVQVPSQPYQAYSAPHPIKN